MRRGCDHIDGFLVVDHDIAGDLGIRENRLDGLSGGLVASADCLSRATSSAAATSPSAKATGATETARACGGLSIGKWNEVAGENDVRIQVAIRAGDTKEIILRRWRGGFRCARGADGPVLRRGERVVAVRFLLRDLDGARVDGAIAIEHF